MSLGILTIPASGLRAYNIGCKKQSESVQSDQNQSSGQMMASGWTIVLDIGKTLSKASLWDEGGACVAQRARPNPRLSAGTSLTLDVTGIQHWMQGVFAEFARLGPVTDIVPVAHGAGVALIREGQLQHAPLDYEWAGVGVERAAYDKQRDPFSATGSPALPGGLNIGMQLHWLQSLRASNFRSGQIIPWAQYWAWALCGVAAAELTSLGCHSDLWRPYEHTPSDLAKRRGWAERLAPLMPAGAVLGTLKPEWAGAAGLSPRVQVYCGLHDSNAALLAARDHPQLAGRDVTVLSTGTWFVAMRTPLNPNAHSATPLPETRDCLVNVDVSGVPIPSSRFMGGREIEILAGTDAETGGSAETRRLSAAINAVEAAEMIMPPCIPGVGPFPKAKSSNLASMPKGDDRMALAQLYAAMLADVCLDLIGSHDALLIDGRFSAAPVFVQALAGLRPTTSVFLSADDNGVAHGALRLTHGNPAQRAALRRAAPLAVDMSPYRTRWREAAERVAQQ
jgi:sugar (pentulose or hexulose) kinase